MSPVHWRKAKAGRIIAAASAVVERFGGRVPVEKPKLLSLPGIAGRFARITPVEDPSPGAP